MIAPGSSERGLSEVTTARSERSAPARPISGRFSRSRSPPQPNTEITRPEVIRRAARGVGDALAALAARELARQPLPVGIVDVQHRDAALELDHRRPALSGEEQ